MKIRRLNVYRKAKNSNGVDSAEQLEMVHHSLEKVDQMIDRHFEVQKNEGGSGWRKIWNSLRSLLS